MNDPATRGRPHRSRFSISPGPDPATIDDLRRIQHHDRLLRAELPRVREAATSWRNGLGALLAALIGFSLIKGRADVGQLAPFWSRAVGVLLLLTLLIGAIGTMLLLRAAHGRPAVTATRELPHGRAADHVEAMASVRALRRGIAATLLFASLLVAAVGATWYGPEKAKPALRVTTPTGVTCGAVVRLSRGTIVLKTRAGEIANDLTTAISVQPVDKCPETNNR